MKLLEYEAKALLQQKDIPTPTSTLVMPETITITLPAVLKSQVPTGGRGKAGGIAIVTSDSEYQAAKDRIFHLTIKGYRPSRLLAEQLLTIKKELYLALLIDRPTASIVLMAHTRGGVEVEENEASEFLRESLTPDTLDQAGERLAEYYDLPDKLFLLQEIVSRLYWCFVENDATLIEINPLVLTAEGDLVAGDCKMECDDSAQFRHPDWAFEAGEHESNFVTLNRRGNVATIANGAGLAMATVDAVSDAGLKPANFLDIGGGANTASVLAAFERIAEYKEVRAIVINIFAGITRCDEVARAIIAARQQIDTLPPLSIRLAGTNFEQAVELLRAESIPVLKTLEECIDSAKREVMS